MGVALGGRQPCVPQNAHLQLLLITIFCNITPETDCCDCNLDKLRLYIFGFSDSKTLDRNVQSAHQVGGLDGAQVAALFKHSHFK